MSFLRYLVHLVHLGYRDRSLGYSLYLEHHYNHVGLSPLFSAFSIRSTFPVPVIYSVFPKPCFEIYKT